MTVIESPAARPAGTAGGGLSLSGVSKTYPDGTHVLDSIDLTVAPGEMVSIVGASGCGKSTILKLASGLLDASSGTINASGGLGYVFQDATLMPWRTVMGNVQYLAELHSHDRARRRQMAEDAIRTVGLSGFENHYPRQLSGGMKMRASIARSLTLDPQIFLFDEPFGALDEITREHLNGELMQLFTRNRFAGVFVTHSVYEAVFLGTRVVVMSPRPGRIVADIPVPFGTRDEELRFSADFAEICGEVSSTLKRVS